MYDRENGRAWIAPPKGKIERSLDARSKDRAPNLSGRRGNKSVSLLIACAIVAIIVSGVLLLPPDGRTEPPETPSDSYVARSPQDPYSILGKTLKSDGVTPEPFCTVNVTNWGDPLAPSYKGTLIVTSDAAGGYGANLANIPDHLYADGDRILVTAEKDEIVGEAEGYVDTDQVHMITLIDVTLGTIIPEFPMVILPVAGMLALFAIVRFRHRKAEEET